MRFISAIPAFLMLGGTALAQTADCRSIPDAAARLACYDKASPIAAAVKPTAAPGRSRSKTDTEGYLESLSAEDARVSTLMNGICRGC